MAADASEPATRRLSLPTSWPPDISRRLRLVRRFGRPHIDSASHAIILKLEHVAGIHSLKLNGRPLGNAAPEVTSYEIPLNGLLERNLLELEIATPLTVSDKFSAAPDWGFVSLVIRPIDQNPTR